MGLIYLRARYYVPGVGSFASADTLVSDPANPQTLNRFSYVLNGPMRYRDPTGHVNDPRGDEWGEPSRNLNDPPPGFPAWDRESGAFRHLVNTCTPDQCSEVIFNAYTPGIWSFAQADAYHLATTHVYEVGLVTEEEALEAARAGEPNPLTDEQMRDGLRMNETDYSPDLNLIGVRNSYWFAFLMQRLGWGEQEMGRDANYEPRYLQELVDSHPEYVQRAFERLMTEARENPVLFQFKNQWWRYSTGRR